MQPNSADPSNANIIPAAHLPQAMQAASANGNPGVMQQLQTIQAQLNALMGVQQQGNLPDVILVNQSGRIVEVDGKAAQELLSKTGFRRATPVEEEQYRKAILLQTPAYLRRMERKRLQDQEKMLDDLEAEGADSATSVADLLQAPVTESQRTGTPVPAQTPSTPAAPAPKADTSTTQTDDLSETPKPRSRRANSADKNKTTPPPENSTPNTNTEQ